jgi:hypothetical protein
MGKFQDLTGKKFGKLIVIKQAEKHVQPSGTSYTRWLCKCECGNEVTVRTSDLTRGHTKSCGCLQKEKVTTHGLKKTRLYVIWRDIKARCFNPNDRGFKNYGAKGIIMCVEWRSDFKAFYDWSMANGYDENAPRGVCTIDRIDNSKGYCPENCRWIDNLAQQNNRTNNRLLTYNNETHSVAEWSRILDISRYALYARLKKGWLVERTLTTPLKQKKQ